MLAQYLKQLRQDAAWTTGQWAQKSGISRTTLWRWEQDKALPRDEELKAALHALAASVPERQRAMEMLWQARAARGIGAVPTVTETGLNRNELLRALRLRQSLPQREAAARLGVNRVTLAGWEGGDHWPETTVLHQICRLYDASLEEITALTTLTVASSGALPSDPDAVVWDDIETYDGDFGGLELRFLTSRARLAQMPQAGARLREVACALDYLHSLLLQARGGEVRRELRRLAAHPMLRATPGLFARHQHLYAVSQKQDARGHRAAENIVQSLLSLGEAVPVGERSRVLGEWATRRNALGDPNGALCLSARALREARVSGDAHLMGLGQREHTATLIDAGKFAAAAKSLELFPAHTPLLAVQRVFTHALLLDKSGSRTAAIAAYGDAANAAQAAGMSSYGDYFRSFASALSDT